MKYSITTTCYKDKCIWKNEKLESNGEPTYGNQVKLYPEERRQVIEGFGGAVTEASGYVLSTLSEEKHKAVIDWYFGRNGLRYNLCRTHMNSCDFALGNYACVEDEKDTKLNTFSIERDKKYVIPMIKEADAAAGAPVKYLLSPWSPPAFMKTNGDMNHGGKLKPEFAQMWAKIIARYVVEFKALGIDVTMVSVQNEPEAVQTWDSCIYTAEEEADFVKKYLRKALDKAGLEDIGIIIWDHNKDVIYDRITTSFADKKAADMTMGVGFHWYGGDHFEALRVLKDKYPDKSFYFTEGCVEYSRLSANSEVDNAEMYANEYIGNINAGTSGLIDWNLLLDKKGGPNHVGNLCDAPVMCCGGKEEVKRNLSYYYIGHFSRFIKAGAVVIPNSRFSNNILATSAINPDGERVVVLLNRTDKNLGVSLCEDRETACNFTVKAHSISTVTYYK